MNFLDKEEVDMSDEQKLWFGESRQTSADTWRIPIFNEVGHMGNVIRIIAPDGIMSSYRVELYYIPSPKETFSTIEVAKITAVDALSGELVEEGMSDKQEIWLDERARVSKYGWSYRIRSEGGRTSGSIRHCSRNLLPQSMVSDGLGTDVSYTVWLDFDEGFPCERQFYYTLEAAKDAAAEALGCVFIHQELDTLHNRKWKLDPFIRDGEISSALIQIKEGVGGRIDHRFPDGPLSEQKYKVRGEVWGSLCGIGNGNQGEDAFVYDSLEEAKAYVSKVVFGEFTEEALPEGWPVPEGKPAEEHDTAAEMGDALNTVLAQRFKNKRRKDTNQLAREVLLLLIESDSALYREMDKGPNAVVEDSFKIADHFMKEVDSRRAGEPE